MFTLLALGLNSEHLHFTVDFKDPFTIAITILSSLVFTIVPRIRARVWERVKGTSSLKQKLMSYRTAMIISFAPIEAIGLMSAVFILISGNTFFLIFTIIFLFGMFSYRPRKEKLIRDLQLTSDEIQALDENNRM